MFYKTVFQSLYDNVFINILFNLIINIPLGGLMQANTIIKLIVIFIKDLNNILWLK